MGWGRKIVVVGLCVGAAPALAGCGGAEDGPEPIGTVTRVASSVSQSVETAMGEMTQKQSTGAPAVDVPERLVADATWVERDGVRALAVTPTPRLREETDPRVLDEAWRRVVRAVPAADTPGMRDQFVCHATFAPRKSAWFLEPSRPAVGYWPTVRAGCNPGDVMDVG